MTISDFERACKLYAVDEKKHEVSLEDLNAQLGTVYIIERSRETDSILILKHDKNTCPIDELKDYVDVNLIQTENTKFYFFQNKKISFIESMKEYLPKFSPDKKLFEKLYLKNKKYREHQKDEIFKSVVSLFFENMYDIISKHIIQITTFIISLYTALFINYELLYLYDNNFIYDGIDFERLIHITLWMFTLISNIGLLVLFLFGFILFFMLIFEPPRIIKRVLSFLYITFTLTAILLLVTDYWSVLFLKKNPNSSFAKEYISRGIYPTFAKIDANIKEANSTVLIRYIQEGMLYYSNLNDLNETALKDYDANTSIVLRFMKEIKPNENLTAINIKEIKEIHFIHENNITRLLKK